MKSDHFTRTPEYTIIREPLEGEIPEFLVMEIELPGIVSIILALINYDHMINPGLKL